MDTEPLKSLLDYSVDKKSTILYFLSKEEQERLQEYIFDSRRAGERKKLFIFN